MGSIIHVAVTEAVRRVSPFFFGCYPILVFYVFSSNKSVIPSSELIWEIKQLHYSMSIGPMGSN